LYQEILMDRCFNGVDFSGVSGFKRGLLFFFKIDIMRRLTLFLLFIVAGFCQLYGQIAIKEDGSPPDNSAILDLQSTSQGLLIPRIDFNNRPDPPATGLMIYVTDNGPLGNNALYVYNGAMWLKLATAGDAIGDHKEGGVVFWIDGSGVHGLVSALADEGYLEWGCYGTAIGPDAQHVEIGTGDTNTAAIVAGCPDPEIAAGICSESTLNGYSDWYLPSRDELYEMYLQQTTIGGFESTDWYWSSTEAADSDDPENAAWLIIFGDGTNAWAGKDSPLLVRCIRKF
jgi:hypothetical protein